MFAAPWWLLLLLAPAVLAAAYVVVGRRARRDVVRFPTVAMLDAVAAARPSRSRHVPIAVLLVALVLVTVALAGPLAQVRVPRNRATVILVIDVSLSMRATDVDPTRLAAAQAAAKSFADQLPPGINLGLISFAGTAAVLVSPSTDRDAVKHAIDGLRLAESTATGEAIFAALQSLDSFARSIAGADEGGPAPARIVLMSDGGQTVPGGPDAENQPRGSFTASASAAQVKVPISTISFGTEYGSITLDGKTVPVTVDDAALQRIADISGGQFNKAESATELRSVYRQLGDQIGYETVRRDDSRPWMIAAALALALGLGVGLANGRRIP